MSDKIFIDQVGFLPDGVKKAVLNFEAPGFEVRDKDGDPVLSGTPVHFGTDDISGEDCYVADLSALKAPGEYYLTAGGARSVGFAVGDRVYDQLMKDICKCFYYLRCGDALDPEFAGVYYHKPCHTTLASVYGEDVPPVEVSGGWHDAGDFGRYSSPGAVTVAHMLYGVRFYRSLLDVEFNIPKVKCDSGFYPDILAEAGFELDFLLKMQREDGSVWHKVTTMNHAPFCMPEDDKEELYLFPVSSMATGDLAAIFALAHTVYRDYDKAYAERLLQASLKSYDWLKNNPEPALFRNPPGNNTGGYGEAEDISNRFWAAAALYEATGERKYHEDALTYREALLVFAEKAGERGFDMRPLTGLGWGDVAGLGALSLFLKGDSDELTDSFKKAFVDEADRLVKVAAGNAFGLAMEPKDFCWGSNMEVLKQMMVLLIADSFANNEEYRKVVASGLDYILGCNSMDVSYVTGHGEKAFKNPHLRPTAVDGIEDPWPGLVSGGPNRGLQDERARAEVHETVPMKCYLDHQDCYSLNEIAIYWNSPLVFALAGLLDGRK